MGLMHLAKPPTGEGWVGVCAQTSAMGHNRHRRLRGPSGQSGGTTPIPDRRRIASGAPSSTPVEGEGRGEGFGHSAALRVLYSDAGFGKPWAATRGRPCA